jgi:Amt family ammonium transporter
MGALAIGLIAGLICAWAVGLKYRLGFDDSLDVVGVHLVGGLIGVLAIGFLGTASTGTAGCADGLFYGGGFSQLGRQASAALAVGIYSFLMAGFLGILIQIGFRVDRDEELPGIDENEHAETAYDPTGLTSSVLDPRLLGPGGFLSVGQSVTGPPSGRHATREDPPTGGPP